MAATAVTRIDAPLNEFGTQNAGFAALDGTDGAIIDLGGGKDCYTLLLFTCSANDNTITIKGGNGDKGGQDVTLAQLDKDKTAGFIIDSAYFMDVSGTNKGKITVLGKATTSVLAIELTPGR